MNTSEILYVGIKGHVLATDKRDGRLLWQTKLKGGFLGAGSGFVTVLVDGTRIYAHAGGELYCLDALSGEQLWTNELAGMGYDLASLAIEEASAPSQAIMARIQQQREQASNSSNTSNT